MTKDGNEMPIEVQGKSIPYQGRDIRVTALRDITDRKHMEQELVRLERLGAAGEMAQGVAHNFNNLLVGVLGFAQLLKRELNSAKLQDYVAQIMQSAQRAQNLVEQLNLSSRHSSEDMDVLDVNLAIEEAIQGARPRWKDASEAAGIQISVTTDLNEVPKIQATAAGLHDILINLIFNAVDAMPEGGTLSFRTQVKDQKVVISIRDTGSGMDTETQRRVFEPFFTTKVDVGTGLGLSTVYATVVNWGGDIVLESELGVGTTFHLSFPVEETLDIQVPSELVDEAPILETGCIWVVEDEDLTRKVLETVLADWASVRIFSDGQQILNAFQPGCCDVVLTDLGLPNMPGDQVVRRLKEIDPNLVTVLMTGWALDEADVRFASFDFMIQKPFDDFEKLEHLLKKALFLRKSRDI